MKLYEDDADPLASSSLLLQVPSSPGVAPVLDAHHAWHSPTATLVVDLIC